jgi:hypothetical protein
VLDKPVRIEFLKKLHLFRGLSDAELAKVADELQELSFDNPGTVFAEGAVADSFHIIYDGRVDITRLVNAKQVKIASLVKGDYYGEQGLLRSRNRNATVTAESGTLILVLYRTQFAQLLKEVPGLRRNFEIMMSSRQLAQERRYTWLSENEVIYFLGRKHPFLLVLDMIVPFFLLFPVFGIIAMAFLFSSAGLGLIGGFLLVADLAWAVWRYVDWGNDYYIVTNQRVIWLEKVIGFYDSRTEASIGTILSVSTETEYLGRILDYGTVVVRTYTGQIRMVYVRNPKQVAAMIEEYLNRAKEVGRKADEETMKQAIRAKLGYTKPGQPVAPPPPPPAPVRPARPVKKPTTLSELWKNAFRMRTVDGNIITYHKHIYGFLRDAGPYALGILALILMVIMWPFIFDFGIPLWLSVLTIFAVIVLFGFIAYEYLDWQNDIYQVTPEQIIDVTRKPFGTEDRKAAPLENILSTENTRNGILGMLLNFGTVYIMVGGAQFNFDDVADPPSVQQDIVQRQQGRLQKKKENETSAERERMSDWLAMYHRTMDEVDREKDQSRQPDSE